MKTATLELYNALLEVGIKKEKAENVAQLVISRAEAKEFATKQDVTELKSELRILRVHLYFLELITVGIFVGLVTNIL